MLRSLLPIVPGDIASIGPLYKRSPVSDVVMNSTLMYSSEQDCIGSNQAHPEPSRLILYCSHLGPSNPSGHTQLKCKCVMVDIVQFYFANLLRKITKFKTQRSRTRYFPMSQAGDMSPRLDTMLLRMFPEIPQR